VSEASLLREALLVAGAQDLQEHCFGLRRWACAKLLSQKIAALSKNTQSLGVVSHCGMQTHQLLIRSLTERLEVQQFRHVLDGESWFATQLARGSQAFEAPRQKRPQHRASRLDPWCLVIGEERPAGDTYDDVGEPPGLVSVSRTQRAFGFVDSACRGFDVDPGSGREADADRAGAYVDRRVGQGPACLLQHAAKLAEDGIKCRLDVVRMLLGPDDVDQFGSAHRPIAIRSEEHEGKPALTPRKGSFGDESVTVFEREMAGEVDSWKRQAFANVKPRSRQAGKGILSARGGSNGESDQLPVRVCRERRDR
jgi:hypothetical protein